MSTSESPPEVENFSRGEKMAPELLEEGIKLTYQALDVVSRPLPDLVNNLKEEAEDGVDGVSIPLDGGGASRGSVTFSRIDGDLRIRRMPRDCLGGRIGNRGRHDWISSHPRRRFVHRKRIGNRTSRGERCRATRILLVTI